jgi:hypothetical protein
VLDEELPTLLPPISGRQSVSDALEVEGREVSQSGQTEVRSQDFVVRQLFHFSVLNMPFIKNVRT